MQRNRHGEAEREKARHTETTLPSLASTDPTVCSPPLAMVTKHLFGCFGLSLRKGCGSGGKAKCVQDCANGDAPGAQQTQESPLQFITGCVLTGHTGWDSRVQRKMVCFSHHSFTLKGKPITSSGAQHEFCLHSSFSLISVDFRFWLLHKCVILITMWGWVFWALIYTPNLVLEIGPLRASKVKWLAKDHMQS